MYQDSHQLYNLICLLLWRSQRHQKSNFHLVKYLFLGDPKIYKFLYITKKIHITSKKFSHAFLDGLLLQFLALIKVSSVVANLKADAILATT